MTTDSDGKPQHDPRPLIDPKAAHKVPGNCLCQAFLLFFAILTLLSIVAFAARLIQ